MTEDFEILVVSSDLESRRQVAGILTKLGVDPICATTLQECNQSLSRGNVGLVFCDPLVSDGTYQDLLGAYRGKESKPRVVITSHFADWEQFKEAMRWGAFDVIAAPCRPTDVEWMVIQAKRDERNRNHASYQPLTERPRLTSLTA